MKKSFWHWFLGWLWADIHLELEWTVHQIRIDWYFNEITIPYGITFNHFRIWLEPKG